MWPDFDYLELNVIFKATQNPKKLLEALKKHEKRLRKIIDAHRHKDTNDSILNADTIAFSAIQNYYDAKIDASQLQKLIAPAVMYQRMLSKATEIYTNDIVVDSYEDTNGLSAVIRSFAVFDYLTVIICFITEQIIWNCFVNFMNSVKTFLLRLE